MMEVLKEIFFAIPELLKGFAICLAVGYAMHKMIPKREDGRKW